ncbi:unnamed protein product [Peronospora destructor]|uniref:SCP domain-containing protein n=1 Tax=Peronospora destructor TaxID=86335 RepID=A0AAV0U0E4_9STRA|nr:unnamed protein product [Peronospora destructor]
MSPLFLLVLAVTVFGFSTAAETDRTPVANRHLEPSSSPYDWHVEMLDLVNQQRAANGVRPLCMNKKLQTAAQVHSTDMATHNCMNHKGWDGSQPQDRVKTAGYVATTTGENVASGQQSVRAVMDSWMKSPKHRANILCPNFTMFGCGYDTTTKPQFSSFWTQVFAASETEQCSK